MDTGYPHTISLKLRDVNQLFNSMDPSPFIEKDLDDDAEEFIVSWAQEFSPKALLKLRIYLDQWPAENPKELIRTAIHNHFAHSAQIADLGFKRLLRQGRTSLFSGLLSWLLVFSSARSVGAPGGCLGCRRTREPYDCRMGRHVATDARRPMQIYLYDWWPLLRRSRIYGKLSHMPVELVQ